MVYVFWNNFSCCTRCIFNVTLLKIDCPVQGQKLDLDDPLWVLSWFRICYDSFVLFCFNAQYNNRKGEKRWVWSQNFVIDNCFGVEQALILFPVWTGSSRSYQPLCDLWALISAMGKTSFRPAGHPVSWIVQILLFHCTHVNQFCHEVWDSALLFYWV